MCGMSGGKLCAGNEGTQGQGEQGWGGRRCFRMVVRESRGGELISESRPEGG